MAWTSPMTFVANNVLTAAQMNTHLRDNLLELAPAKATTNQGSLFIGQGPNRLEERIFKGARVTTSEGTTSNSYTDLATVGPQVTVTSGTSAIVFMACRLGNTTAQAKANMSFAVTGYTDRGPDDGYSIQSEGRSASTHATWGCTFFVNDLNPGVNIFTCKYQAGEGTAEFADRFIGVMPL